MHCKNNIYYIIIKSKGIKFWNYNKNENDVKRGVKLINIQSDGSYITPKKGKFKKILF